MIRSPRTTRPTGRRAAAAAVLLGLVLAGCELLTTEVPLDADLFDAPLPGLTDAEMNTFIRGDEEFGRRFAPASGLGPIFNDVACAECHSGDGRGRPENALTRFSRGLDPARDVGGPQLQDRAIPGAVPETVPPGVDVSLRLPPPVFGVGLIEAIPVESILAHADEDDADGDGISGRPAWVTPPDWVPASEPGGGTGPQLGRFSRKAQVSSLLQQVVEAYHQDIGVTSDFLPLENENPLAPTSTRAIDPAADPEIPESTVRAVVEYIRMLAPPAPGEDTPARARGRTLFREVGCAGCHVPEYRTGEHRIAALSNQRVGLYSDLLLHDLGHELSDDRPDGAATGREWRTTPLWGLRLMRDFLDGDAFLMHDGRAASIEEAILLHGGEAEAVRRRFEALAPADRDALIEFVGSR